MASKPKVSRSAVTSCSARLASSALDPTESAVMIHQCPLSQANSIVRVSTEQRDRAAIVLVPKAGGSHH